MALRHRPARGAGCLNITLLAVGKASKGPEHELCARYEKRTASIGAGLGIRSLAVRELKDGSGPNRARDEGTRLLSAHPGGEFVALDEGGDLFSSAQFAQWIVNYRERGVSNLTFAIGGADGHDPQVLAGANKVLSLGRITLPHMLARAILLEQIYRALTICLGHPYHRS